MAPILTAEAQVSEWNRSHRIHASIYVSPPGLPHFPTATASESFIAPGGVASVLVTGRPTPYPLAWVEDRPVWFG